MPLPAAPTVGRTAEITEIRAALTRTTLGAGGCVTVEGPAGIGKSRLLAEAVAEGRRLRLCVASGRATLVDRAAPLSSLLTALRHGQPPVLAAPPVPDPELALDAARFWLIDEIRENIEAFARHQPLLIALDDVQWADELTVLALNTLIPAVATVPVCWLLARRTGARRTAALDWPALEHARRLRLEPLARPAVSQLCTHLLGALPDPNLLALIDRGGGNPFLIEELLNALRGEERIQLSAGTATITGGELPADFVAAVDRRLGDHSPAARQVLDAGAILGRPFTVHEVAALTGLPVPEAIGAAREGVSAGVLVEVDDDLGFRHDLLREAVYRALSRATRRALHREAVRVLQGEGRPAAEVAGHVTRYARKGDLAALGQLRDAVKEVMSVAPGVAADLLSKILDLTPVPHGDRPDLIADRIRMLAAAGRLAEALAASEAALKENLDPAAEAAILVGLSETLKHSGRDSVVVHQAERALERPGVPPAMRARLHAVQAHGLLYTSDLAAAEPAARAAMDLGDAAGDSSAVVFGGAARSVVARWRGQLTQSVALARAAVQRADEAGGDARLRHPRAWLGRALISVDQFDEAQAVLAQGKRETQELGTAWSLPVIHGYQAQLLLATGRLEEAVVEAESGLRVATQLEAWALSELLVSIRIWLAVSQRQMAEAQAYLRRSQRRSRRLSAQPSRGWAFVQDGRGRPEEAVTAFLSRYDRLAEEPGLLTEEPLGAAYLVRLALRAGRPDLAGRAARAARVLAAENATVPSLCAAAYHAEGLRDRDAAALRHAVERYRAEPRRLALCSALEDAATIELPGGDRDRSVSLLDEALRGYSAAGATRDTARVIHRLRELGVRRRRPAATTQQRAGWASLTPAELGVVRLVAEGMTNRAVAAQLHLSPHTVDSHLRHAYVKLGVTGRVELARRVASERPDRIT